MTAHIISRDEVMAFLDGELAPPRAAIVRAHVEGCSECGAVVSGLRALTDAIRDWLVEPAPESLVAPHGVVVPPTAVPHAKTARLEAVLTFWRVAPWLAAAATVIVVSDVVMAPRMMLSYVRAVDNKASGGPASSLSSLNSVTGGDSAERRQFDANGALQKEESKDGPVDALKQTTRDGSGFGRGVAGGQVQGARPMPAAAPAPPQTAAAARMLVRTAYLSISTDRFDDVQARLERVAAARGGVVSGYQLSGTRETGRGLSATLRVPVGALDAVMADLRGVGTVTSESQQTEEVTDAHRDLAIRIDNAKREAARLNELLTRQSDRLSDVLEVEQAQARVQTSIEQMTAEETAMRGRAAMSTIQVQVAEQRHAELALGPLPIGTRIRNAMVDGVRAATESAIGAMLTLISLAPTLLLWLVVVVPPAFLAWWATRMLRTRRAAR
jgi:hypothetical protein